MNDKLTQALNSADTAALRRSRYRAAAEQFVLEADALAAQADAKRAESTVLLTEAERQDAAYASALDQIVEQGVDRADAESMVATRVKILLKSGVDIPLPTAEAARQKPRPAAKRKQKDQSEPAADRGPGVVGETPPAVDEARSGTSEAPRPFRPSGGTKSLETVREADSAAADAGAEEDGSGERAGSEQAGSEQVGGEHVGGE